MAESFSREKLRHTPQKEGGREILPLEITYNPHTDHAGDGRQSDIFLKELLGKSQPILRIHLSPAG